MEEISLRNNTVVCYTVKKQDDGKLILTGHYKIGGQKPAVGDTFTQVPFENYQSKSLVIEDISFRMHRNSKYEGYYEFYTAICRV